MGKIVISQVYKAWIEKEYPDHTLLKKALKFNPILALRMMVELEKMRLERFTKEPSVLRKYEYRKMKLSREILEIEIGCEKKKL